MSTFAAPLVPAAALESALANLVRPFAVVAGATLFAQGDAADGLYLIERGLVQVSARLPGDEEIVLATLGPGDVLGELALLDGQARSARAKALEDTVGHLLDRRAFDALRASFAPGARALRARLAHAACARLRALDRAITAALPANEAQAAAPRPPREDVARAPASITPRDLVAALGFFRRFTASERETLLDAMVQWELPRGHRLMREGEVATGCFVVVRGAVEVTSADRVRLALLGPGALVGCAALVDEGTRSATCVVREDAVLLELSKADFDRLLSVDSSLAAALADAVLASLVSALRGGNRRLSGLTVAARCAA